MFETIKRLYAKTENKMVVSAAVAKNWITADQAELILTVTPEA